MSVQILIEFTGFMMNVKEDTMLNYGNYLGMYSIVCLLPP